MLTLSVCPLSLSANTKSFSLKKFPVPKDRLYAYIAAIEMSTLEVKIPDLLLQQVNEVAVKEKVTVDQIVSIALAAQVSASQTRESISSRAQRVDWRKVDAILARVPADPPLPG